MAIAEQFAGLEMDKLIGAPLTAAADASIQLADSTASFINRVGFDAGGKVRTAAFSYHRRSMNEDGTSNLEEMKVDVPMLAIVPIPNLQIDEVNVLFDMEVKQSEKQESSMDMGASLSGSLRIGPIKVSVSGSVSAHSSNTRSSDNSAKYHVDVRATNHEMPEGLARVLDMMAACVSPQLVNSEIRDGNGQSLSDNARMRAERLKELRQEIQSIESRKDAAKNSLDTYIQKMKNIATSQQNVYQAELTRMMNALDMENQEDKKKAEAYENAMDEVNTAWNDLRNQTADKIKLLSDSGGAEKDKVAEIFALKAFKNGASSDYTNGESQYNALASVQYSAVAAQQGYDSVEAELLSKKAAYNSAISGGTDETSANDSGVKKKPSDVTPRKS